MISHNDNYSINLGSYDEFSVIRPIVDSVIMGNIIIELDKKCNVMYLDSYHRGCISFFTNHINVSSFILPV